MAHAFAARFLRETVNSGSLNDLNASAGAGANTTTIARYAAGGGNSARRFTPLTAVTANATAPAVGTAPAAFGWETNTPEDSTNQITTDAGTWTVKLRLKRSGQALELDQQTNGTVVLYRIGGGTAEICRGTWSAVTVTTTAQDVTISIPSVAATVFAAGSKVRLVIYIVATLAGVATPPVVATDINCVIAETSANGAKVQLPGYTIQYVQSVAVSGTGTATLGRALTLHRAISVAGVGTATLSRFVAFKRTLSVQGVGSVSVRKKITRTLSVAGTGTVSFIKKVTKTISVVGTGTVAWVRRLVLHRLFNVVGTGTATLGKRMIFHRTIAATGIGVIQWLAKLDFKNIPSAGTTIIKRVLNIWED